MTSPDNPEPARSIPKIRIRSGLDSFTILTFLVARAKAGSHSDVIADRLASIEIRVYNRQRKPFGV